MLKAGDKAPKFELPSDSGKKLGPQSFPGKHVVVYFYPRDNTPGCTREAQSFAALSRELSSAGAIVLGVSRDSIASHASFRERYKLNFPLLSDPDLSVHKAFGAFGEKTLYGKKVLGTIRSTFIVDPGGRVAKVFPNVKVDGHGEAVIAALGALTGAPSSKTAKAAPKPAARPAKAKARPAKATARSAKAAAPKAKPAKARPGAAGKTASARRASPKKR